MLFYDYDHDGLIQSIDGSISSKFINLIIYLGWPLPQLHSNLKQHVERNELKVEDQSIFDADEVNWVDLLLINPLGKVFLS